LHYDKNTNFEQFINDFVEIRNFIESDSFYNFQHFLLRYVEKTFDKTKIKKSRNVVEFDRRRRRKKDIFEHFRFFIKCFNR
jgi:hypothetical protein